MTGATADAERSAMRVRAAVEDFVADVMEPGRPLLVACSGGADSLALAIAVAALGGPGRRHAATVDHGLQDGSTAQAERVAATLAGLGYLDPAVLRVSVTGDGGPEAAARAARYAALEAHARRIEPAGAAVLLAHTRDDQAETVLLGLGRGSGPRSIAGMRAWRPPWGRPLLGVSRADTENACRAAGLEFWTDPHNLDPAFTRVRLRREVLPLLDDVLGGGVRPALARTGALLAEDLDALDDLAADELRTRRSSDGRLRLEGLGQVRPAIRRRVLRTFVSQAGAGALTYEHLTRLDRLAADPRGPSQVRLPGAVDAVRDGALLLVVPVSPQREGSGGQLPQDPSR